VHGANWRQARFLLAQQKVNALSVFDMSVEVFLGEKGEKLTHLMCW
jgi:hypothetical protein